MQVAAAVSVLGQCSLVEGGHLLDPVLAPLLELADAAATAVSDREIESLDSLTAAEFASAISGVLCSGSVASRALGGLRRRLVADRSAYPGDGHSGHGGLDAASLSPVPRGAVAAFPLPYSLDSEDAPEELQIAALGIDDGGLYSDVRPGPARVSDWQSEVFGAPPGTIVQVTDVDALLWRVHLNVEPAALGLDAGRQWLRVLRADDLLSMALAPLDVDRSGTVVSEFVLPPGYRFGDLRFVLADPAPAVGGDRVDMVRQAFALGREAARLTRLDGTSARATEAWMACAAAWAEAGDEPRALIAESFLGSRGWRRPMVEATLADRVTHELVDS